MRKLFSYVVDSDSGLAPASGGNFCSLAKCKYKKKKRNIVEMARKGDWIVGTGGKSKRSAGPGKLIYAMRVDRKISLEEYCRDYPSRIDAEHWTSPRMVGAPKGQHNGCSRSNAMARRKHTREFKISAVKL